MPTTRTNPIQVHHLHQPEQWALGNWDSLIHSLNITQGHICKWWTSWELGSSDQATFFSHLKEPLFVPLCPLKMDLPPFFLTSDTQRMSIVISNSWKSGVCCVYRHSLVSSILHSYSTNETCLLPQMILSSYHCPLTSTQSLTLTGQWPTACFLVHVPMYSFSDSQAGSFPKHWYLPHLAHTAIT